VTVLKAKETFLS